MLPVCSAATGTSAGACTTSTKTSSHPQFSFRNHNGYNNRPPIAFLHPTHAAKSIRFGTSATLATGLSSNHINCNLTTKVHVMTVQHMIDVDVSAVPVVQEERGLAGITEAPVPSGNSDMSLEATSIMSENPDSQSPSSAIGEYYAGMVDSLNGSVDSGRFFMQSIIESATKSIHDAYNEAFSTLYRTKELSANSFTNGFQQVATKANSALTDALRHTVAAAENYLSTAASFVVYSYGSAKDLLPAEVRNTVNMYEQKSVQLLRPVSTASREVYVVIEGFEKSLGLDPNDPLVPFFIFLGSSATLWAFYWAWTYGGYSGDLSPKSALETLQGDRNAVLIDVRNEVLREKDGIPDIRRSARFRYANVTPPEVTSSVQKLLKGGRDLGHFLTAAIIRNLKIVQDSSKVIVLDADGTYSKGIARSLRKLGVKKSYLVQGGYRAWVNQGLRIKDLKPETTLTILNEEAEAILEDINPSPVQLLSFGVVLLVAFYALIEWETTLQWIGVFGLIQTLYRRAASYESAADFKRDITLLLVPVRLGAQALTWASGKLETNGIGLPTSPSSTDVQNRVLQAAAKHESQPSDSTGIEDPFPEPTVTVNENVDLSEA